MPGGWGTPRHKERDPEAYEPGLWCEVHELVVENPEEHDACPGKTRILIDRHGRTWRTK